MNIRDNLQTIDGENLKPSQLRSMGFPIFMSMNAVDDQETIQTISEYYRSIHATTYGQMLPSTSTKVEHSPTITGGVFEEIYAPGANEVLEIQAIQINNVAAAPVKFQIGCYDVACYAGTVDPTSTFCVPLSDLPLFSNGQGSLAFNQVDGSVGNLTVKVVYSMRVM